MLEEVGDVLSGGAQQALLLQVDQTLARLLVEPATAQRYRGRERYSGREVERHSGRAVQWYSGTEVEALHRGTVVQRYSGIDRYSGTGGKVRIAVYGQWAAPGYIQCY